MDIIVSPCNRTADELISSNPLVKWTLVESIESSTEQNADAFFFLSEDAGDRDYSFISKPVFVNSVVKTLSEISGNKNVIRINGWNGFLSNTMWEVCGTIDVKVKDIICN